MPLRSIFLVLCAFFALTACAQTQFILTPTLKQADLAPHMGFLLDPGGSLPIDVVASSTNWEMLPGSFNKGFTNDALWLRVVIERPVDSPREWLLEVNNAVLDDLRLYERTADGTWVVHRSGNDIARDQWDLPYHNPIFRINLIEPGQHTLWLRVMSRTSISAKVTLWQPMAFGDASRGESLAYGFLLGIYVIIFIIHVFFWYWTRESTFGWYAAYVINSSLHVAIAYGYIQQYSGMSGQVSNVVLSLLICGSLALGAKMSAEVLELPVKMPRTSRWLVRSMLIGSIVTSSLSLTVNYAAGVAPAQLIAVAEIVAFVVISLNLLIRRHQPAAFFLAAFGFYCVGALLRVARNFMLLPPTIVTDNSFQIGAVAHMILMSLAIIHRYNNLKVTATQAQTEALRLKTARAEELEREVESRTASLKAEIEQRGKLEAELRASLDVEKQARQQQLDFVSMVSHEFRTPLAIIDISTQRIAGSPGIGGATHDRCSNIRKATRRMTRLIDGFLTLDRLDGDLRAFTVQEECTENIVRGAVSEWDAGRVEVSYLNLPPRVQCDAGLLRVALRNLLANALRHSPENAPVLLQACGTSDGGVKFDVIDTGSGIPADEIPKIFQKYFRGRAAQNKPGAGLGLYLVEQIARLHGGIIEATSNNSGSRFTLTIPRPIA